LIHRPEDDVKGVTKMKKIETTTIKPGSAARCDGACLCT